MEVYKLRHKPTGLFYKPVQGRFKDTRTHLSPSGKLYQSKVIELIPSDMVIAVNNSQIKKYDLIVEPERKWADRNELQTAASDWEMVTYDMVERGTDTECLQILSQLHSACLERGEIIKDKVGGLTNCTGRLLENTAITVHVQKLLLEQRLKHIKHG